MACEILEMIEFEAGNDPIAWYAKGTIDPEEFVAEMRKRYGLMAQVAKVRHVHMRYLPASQNPEDHMGSLCLYPVEPKRGSFPVTIVEYVES
jgi:hypothetical protein